jgi:23S rRNA pseudouridine2457 synthase
LPAASATGYLIKNYCLNHYYRIHKPYYMLSQFRGGARGLHMLGELDYDFPEGIHAVGRLDYHSEGLLLLTTDKRVTRLLFESEVKHRRTYLVQVYKEVSAETVELLRTGVTIRGKGGADYISAPCDVAIVERPAGLPVGPHELRSDIAQTWLQLTLTEGRFRQVRKMMTAVHHNCMRLIRLSIEDLELGDLPPRAVEEMDAALFFERLHISNWELPPAGECPETAASGTSDNLLPPGA